MPRGHVQSRCSSLLQREQKLFPFRLNKVFQFSTGDLFLAQNLATTVALSSGYKIPTVPYHHLAEIITPKCSN
jgi:hypothetical protein